MRVPLFVSRSPRSERKSAGDCSSSTDKSFGLLSVDQPVRLVTYISACFGADRSLDECIGLFSQTDNALRLADHSQRPAGLTHLVQELTCKPSHDRMMDDAERKRDRNGDRFRKVARLIDLMSAGQFAAFVQGEDARPYRIERVRSFATQERGKPVGIVLSSAGSSMSVVQPTATPGTSVIALSGRDVHVNGRPRSRPRGRLGRARL
jgi:hypothetical protein